MMPLMASLTPEQAFQMVENLRQSVVTVSTKAGIQPLNGADHDLLREAVAVLRAHLSGSFLPKSDTHEESPPQK